MEVVDTNLLELDGEMVGKETIEELAEKILEVKSAQKKTPQLFEAAARKLVDDGKLIAEDKELKLFADKKVKLEEEIATLKKQVGPQKEPSLKEKMKAAAKEAKAKKSEEDDEESEDD
jgi:hypothetical protein